MKRTKILLVLLSLLSSYATLIAQVPQTMNYQGVLTDIEGNAVEDGEYSIMFTLYDAAADGNNLWTETQTVSVTNGIFNVILGSINPLTPSFNQKYWLGIKINSGEELTPRIELTSSAYSLNTKTIPNNIVTGEKVANGNLVRSVNSLTDNVTIAGGSNVTITETGNTITISASGGGGSSGITSVSAGNGLTGGGSTGDVTLNVGAGDGIAVSNSAVALNTTYTDSRYVNTGESNSITNSMIKNNEITAAKISTNIVSSLDGVSNDGGNIDLVAGSNITITPDDANNKITISASGGASGDNLGNHTATQNIKLNGHYLSGDGGPEGIFIKNNGNVGIGSDNPNEKLYVKGNIKCGTLVTGIPSTFGNTGDIIADKDLKADNNIYCGGFINAGSAVDAGGYISAGANIVGRKDLIVYDHCGINRSSVSSYYQLYVSGGAYCTDSWVASDLKFKKNIIQLKNPIEQLKRLKGVSYNWRTEEYKDRGFSNTKQFGLIAQEVEKIFPNLVREDENGEKAVNYIGLIPLLLESIKAQQAEIDKLYELINR